MAGMSKALAGGIVLAAVAAAGCGPQARQSGPAKAAAPTPVVSPSEFVGASIAREDAIDFLVREAGAGSAQVRANALEALESAPGRLREVILSGLRDPNEGVRTVSAMIVGRNRMSEMGVAVDPLLDDQSGFVRASAIYALRRCGRDVDPTPLASLLLEHPNARVRAHTAFVLGEIGDPSALALLRTASITPTPRATASERRLLELQISEAMIKLGDDGELQTVRAALYPSRPEQLEATALAVQIIGEVKDRGSIDQLIYMSAYEGRGHQKMPAEVRLGIADSLAKLGLRDGSFIADEYAASDSAAIRAQVATVYGRTGEPTNLGKLRRMMDDQSVLVRVAAAGGILSLTSETAVRQAAHPTAID